MIKKLLAALFAAVGICAGAAAVHIGMNYTDTNPWLLSQPTVARDGIVRMMDAVCAGDYEAASLEILGNPSLGVDREAADEAGVLIWNAFQDSMQYELAGECYSTEDGLAQDITVSCMDIESVTVNLKERAQTLLEQRVREAEDPAEIYDENNEYRGDFVMQVLYDAAAAALREDAVMKTVELTVKLSYQNGRWWVVADNGLFNAISGGILY